MREFIQQPQIPLSQPGGPPKTHWNPFTRFVSIVCTLLILGLLLYGGALVLSRTAGCSEIIQGRLEKQTGLEFKVGSSALTPALDLVLTDVKAMVPKHPLGAGVEAKRVVIRWKWGNLFFASDELKELRAEGVDLHFGLDAAGQWQPAQFGQISRWIANRLQMDLMRYTNLTTTSANAPATPKKIPDELDLFAEERVQVADALIHWQVVADSEIARVEGASLTSTAVKLPNRAVTHLLFGFRRADTAQGFHAAEKQMEMLDLEGREVWISGAPTNAPVPPRAPIVRQPEPRKTAASAVAVPAPKPAIEVVSDPAPQPARLPVGAPEVGPEE